ncbi:MAG: ABC transporter substrate-binding protein [Chloroflexota bacterium]|nr:ABC transporter substrate-binding protein [Chloroflexota bacterium]
MTKSQTPSLNYSLDIIHWTLLIVHWTLLIVLVACTRPDDVWNRMLEAGTLRVGMDASFPPFESISNDGTLTGFDVALARELGRRMGVEVQFVANLPYDGLYDALTANRVDVVISALVVNPDRMTDFAYSAPYFDAGQVLVMREGETGVERVADLSGRTLAVEFGARGDMEARRWTPELSDLTILPYQTAAEALEAVAAGEADAALVDHVSALMAIGKTPGVSENLWGLGVIGKPVVEEPYAVAVRKESRRLLRAINDALAEMQMDGTLEMLVERWVFSQ